MDETMRLTVLKRFREKGKDSLFYIASFCCCWTIYNETKGVFVQSLEDDEEEEEAFGLCHV
jgi:hypothetical protein